MSAIDPPPWTPAKTGDALRGKAKTAGDTAKPAGTDTADAGPIPVILSLADVQPESVRWLWPGRVGLGKLTLLAGDPGLGKSFITLDMAARVSTGMPWPDARAEPNPAGGVVLLSAEDDPADTIRPRLDAAGADVSRIRLLQAVRHSDPETGVELEKSFCLTRDLQALELAVQQTPTCRLVVIDPITAYVGKTDSHVNAEVRGLLAPLVELARRCGVAIVAVTHLNKASTMPAVYLAMGSLAFVAAARSVWAVTKDKDNATERRLFLPVKNNLGNDRTGLAYRLEQTGNESAYVAWEPEPISVSADDALGERDKGDEQSDRAQAAEWLRDALADGPVRSTDVIAQAKANGISEKTLRRGFHDMGGKPRKGSFDGGWYWELPCEDGQAGPEDAQDGHPNEKGTFGQVGHLGSAEGDDWGEL